MTLERYEHHCQCGNTTVYVSLKANLDRVRKQIECANGCRKCNPQHVARRQEWIRMNPRESVQ